mmetsp:Transcript_1894/g.2807  ORF Transcript_1894/g.2807 Transcript_1894/m.2807 type:complete len:220 (+) Transcript_1894:2579-3238(+)
MGASEVEDLFGSTCHRQSIAPDNFSAVGVVGLVVRVMRVAAAAGNDTVIVKLHSATEAAAQHSSCFEQGDALRSEGLLDHLYVPVDPDVSNAVPKAKRNDAAVQHDRGEMTGEVLDLSSFAIHEGVVDIKQRHARGPQARGVGSDSEAIHVWMEMGDPTEEHHGEVEEGEKVNQGDEAAPSENDRRHCHNHLRYPGDHVGATLARRQHGASDRVDGHAS